MKYLSIVKFKIQLKDINILNQQCDELISNKKFRKQLNVSDKLSKSVKGDIQEELTCELKDNKMNSFRKTLYDAVEFLYKNKFNYTQVNMELDIHNAWYVRSFEGDFNPCTTTQNTTMLNQHIPFLVWVI